MLVILIAVSLERGRQLLHSDWHNYLLRDACLSERAVALHLINSCKLVLVFVQLKSVGFLFFLLFPFILFIFYSNFFIFFLFRLFVYFLFFYSFFLSSFLVNDRSHGCPDVFRYLKLYFLLMLHSVGL